MRWYLFIVFIVFSAVIAPIQFHLDWFPPLRTEQGSAFFNALGSALVPGTLYFYSIVLAAETFFRLENHPEIDQQKVYVKILRFACGLPLLLFIFEFLPFYLKKRQLDGVSLLLQASLAVLSFSLAIAVYFVVQKADKVTDNARN